MADRVTDISSDGLGSLELPSGLAIPAEDWARTPRSVHVVVVMLWQRVQALQGLEAQVQSLQAEVAELRERLGQTSQNSSKPPSSDPPSAPPRPSKPGSGRSRGGQQGHPGHGRRLVPLEEVDRVVDGKPLSCGECGALLLGDDPDPARHQVTELPRVEPEVTEYRRHALQCLACGATTRGEWPEEMPSGSFGPRVQATVGYLTGRMGMSQRDVEEVMDTVFHTGVSLGSIPALEQAVSAALGEPVAEAQVYVEEQSSANADETSWREEGKRSWLWVCVTEWVTVFQVMGTRGQEGVKKLLGAFGGILGSDRLSAYNLVDPERRQLCWAHLRRDFQAFVDRCGESARIGQALLGQAEKLFELWYRVRDGTLSRADFQVAMAPVRREVGILLREGATVSHAKTRRTCANLLKLEVALWTFVFYEGVEPTNNAAERALRRGVLWRRRSFGTQSEAGSRFVERVLTTVTTLRQQGREVLDYLTEACAAAIQGEAPPSLLPIYVASSNP